MKALILANMGKSHFYKNKIVPSCFLPLHNQITVIERQISLLNVNGFLNDDICVLFGMDGVWDTDYVKQKIQTIKTNKIFVKHRGNLKENMFASDFFSDDLLILDGNRVFDIGIIARLMRYRERNVMVTEDLTDPDDLNKSILVEDNKVISIEDAELISFPWTSYAGIIKLSAEKVNMLKHIVTAPISLLDAISKMLDCADIGAIKYDDIVYGRVNGGHSDELTGGSYSKLNYRLVVKKEAEGKGRSKLINEIEWLLSIPKELKPYFSEVLEYDIESPHVFYNVPYYGSRNLREHIFMGDFNADDTILFLKDLLQWMFQNVYSRKISDAPKDWLIQKHINRVLDRLPECCEKSDELRKLINAKKIIINGKEYRNVRELYEIILNNEDFINRLNPKELVMIHGDLHFQNILLSNETDTGFILVDPRGEKLGSDIYYDIGKLLHSFHAKYDFIHSDQFKLKVDLDKDIPVTSFEFTNEYMVNIYDEIYIKFLDIIQTFEYFKKDPDWKMKAYFAEASHLCSVMTFHVGKTDNSERVMTLYLTGVILINEFFEQFMEN